MSKQILLNMHIDSDPDRIYQYLSTASGIKNWWTSSVESNAEIGIDSIITFRFSSGAFNTMKVTKLVENEEVGWECIDGAKQWIGTQLIFKIERSEDHSFLKFSQSGWEKDDDFFAFCSFGWAYYLMSLRKFLKGGKGYPDSGPETR